MDVWLVEADRHNPFAMSESLVVRSRVGIRDPRRYMVMGAISGPGRKLVVNASDVETLATSVLERVLYYRKGNTLLDPLVPLVDVGASLRGFRNLLVSVFGTKPSPVTPEEFAEQYNGRRRTIYLNAVEEFYNGVTRRHSRIKAFVKAEKVERGKSPRCIQPRDPVYNVALGRYLKHIEHSLYRAVARVFRQKMVVSKGYNVEELGELVSEMWDEVVDPCFIGFDASRFDFHVGVDVLRWEHSVYLALYRNNPELAELLRWQLRVDGRGYADNGAIKYSANGRRMSGDMNTGLGNVLIACAIVHKALGRSRQYRFINNGDDCGVIVPRRWAGMVAEIIPLEFEAHGFRVVVEEPVYQLEKLVFCQMQPVEYDVGKWRMVRQFETAREKDSISLMPFSSIEGVRKWMNVVGEGGLSMCAGIPVFQALYSAYVRMGLPSNMASATYMECGAMFLARRMEAKAQPITTTARVSFYSAFGVTPDEQIVLEQHYSRLEMGSIRTGDLDDVTTCPL